MAPTIPAALVYSTEHKLRKPVVEKMRRDRINSSIEQLKALLGSEILQQNPDSKLEKADVLEMTVCLLRRSSTWAAQSQGFSRCVQEIQRFLSQDQEKTQCQERLLSHFQKLQPSWEQRRTPAVLAQPKEKHALASPIWRPW